MCSFELCCAISLLTSVFVFLQDLYVDNFNLILDCLSISKNKKNLLVSFCPQIITDFKGMQHRSSHLAAVAKAITLLFCTI